MKINPKSIFHYISYLQYPLLLIAIYYVFVPILQGFDNPWFSINKALIFMGIGISFSSLQDTQKTQNNFSKKVWENPKKGKFFLLLMGLTMALFLVVGIFGLYSADEAILKEISLGTIVLGIGYMGLWKSAMEMFENHRKDKNPDF
jgi:hypothetical protein